MLADRLPAYNGAGHGALSARRRPRRGDPTRPLAPHAHRSGRDPPARASDVALLAFGSRVAAALDRPASKLECSPWPTCASSSRWTRPWCSTWPSAIRLLVTIEENSHRRRRRLRGQLRCWPTTASRHPLPAPGAAGCNAWSRAPTTQQLAICGLDAARHRAGRARADGGAEDRTARGGHERRSSAATAFGSEAGAGPARHDRAGAI
jgi:hypothetical protein